MSLRILCLLALAGCGTKPAVGEPLARVNGTPIAEADVRLKLHADGKGGQLAPEHVGNVLEAVIRQELMAQRAVAAGLEADPALAERLEEIEAQARARRRAELADAYFRHELARRSQPTREEVQRFYDQSQKRLGTELHVWQILRKGRVAIEQAQAELGAGKPFEEVAQAGLAAPPPSGQRPWDLGYLNWKQIPAAWSDTVEALEPGEVSGAIEGPGDRFWIVKLVERRQVEVPSFELLEPVITETLAGQAHEATRAALDRELRRGAEIEYERTPSAQAR